MDERCFFQVISRHARQMPEHPAYIFQEQTMTYRQFEEAALRLANTFLALGLQKGDRVATVLPQSPAFVTVFMAAAALGLVVVPLDPRFRAAEMIALGRRTRPKLLVALAHPEPVKQAVEELAAALPFSAGVYSFFGDLAVPGAKPYNALLAGPPTPVVADLQPDLDDPLIIIFTSGSTGTPKGAVISHRNTLAMARATINAWGVNADDRAIINLPTSHVGGTHDLIAVQLYAGATGILMPSFDPAAMLEVIGRHRITYFGGVPTMFRLLFKTCSVRDYNVASARLIVVSGEPAAPELIFQVQKNFPNAAIVASWGMSETAGFFTFSRPDDPLEKVATTEGVPGDGFQMKIRKVEGSWAAPGETGEMLVKGDSVISTYMDPGDNEGTFVDGWLRTGDLGWLDEDNYLHFVGRLKEMYISGGYNVYPLEIESCLNAHPKINTSCIIEVPDEIFGEVGYAFVVPEAGTTLTVAEVTAYCEQQLADYKRPKKIFIRDDLPKTLIGKLAKQEIRQNLDKYCC